MGFAPLNPSYQLRSTTAGVVERSETHRVDAQSSVSWADPQIDRPNMPRYRRHFVPGGSYFFTVNLNDRSSRLLTEQVDLLRAAFRYARESHKFSVDAIVILPEHLHCIWTLPAGDSDFAMRWRIIKSAFSRGLPRHEWISPSRLRKGERGIWQRRYWEHTPQRR
jgi:putative transposase